MMRTLIPLYFLPWPNWVGGVGGNEQCHNKSFCWRTSCNCQNAVWERRAGSVKSSSTSFLQEKFPQSLSRTKGVSKCKGMKSRLLETEKSSAASGGIRRLSVQNGNAFRRIQFQTILFGLLLHRGERIRPGSLHHHFLDGQRLVLQGTAGAGVGRGAGATPEERRRLGGLLLDGAAEGGVLLRPVGAQRRLAHVDHDDVAAEVHHLAAGDEGGVVVPGNLTWDGGGAGERRRQGLYRNPQKKTNGFTKYHRPSEHLVLKVKVNNINMRGRGAKWLPTMGFVTIPLLVTVSMATNRVTNTSFK